MTIIQNRFVDMRNTAESPSSKNTRFQIIRGSLTHGDRLRSPKSNPCEYKALTQTAFLNTDFLIRRTWCQNAAPDKPGLKILVSGVRIPPPPTSLKPVTSTGFWLFLWTENGCSNLTVYKIAYRGFGAIDSLQG